MEDHKYILALDIKYHVAYLILISTVIAFSVQNVAQRYISSMSTSLILTLDAVFGSIFAVIYLNDYMTITMVIGCIAVLLGIVIQTTKPAKLHNNKKS